MVFNIYIFADITIEHRQAVVHASGLVHFVKGGRRVVVTLLKLRGQLYDARRQDGPSRNVVVRPHLIYKVTK